MQITLVQGLLIALLVFICAIDKHMETFMWFRPLVVAFFTGIILGDVRLGMQAGAVAELSYLGLLTVGGTVPPDPLFAGLMTTVLAYTTGCDVNTALGLAVPFALIGQWINTGTNTFYAGFLPKVDKCAAAGDEKGIAKVMYTGWILYAAMFALAAFLSTYALQSGISAFVAAFPAWLVHGFEVAGGLMPAVGLALLLVVMLKKENAACWFCHHGHYQLPEHPAHCCYCGLHRLCQFHPRYGDCQADGCIRCNCRPGRRF